MRRRRTAAIAMVAGGLYAMVMAVAAQRVSGAQSAAGAQSTAGASGAAGAQGTAAGAASAPPQAGQVPARSVSTAVPGGAGPQNHRLVAYPERPKAPQEVLDRGKAVFGVNCAFCHGSDAGGGEVGPNLWRSSVVLEDQDGEGIAPIVHGARADKGMPAIPINDAQIKDVAAWLHSLKVVSRTDPDAKINIVTGDPKAGAAFFQKTCSGCHSATGDMKGLATRIPDPKKLQQAWLLPGGGGGRPAEGVHVSPVTVTVTPADGKSVTGTLGRIDDFYIGLVEPDGEIRGFTRDGDVPKVELHDPLKPHRELLRTYNDKDIHDLTAYLETLK